MDKNNADKQASAENKKNKKPNYGFYRFLRVFLRPLNRILWPTRVINLENFDKIEGGLVICNHYSKVDALIPTAYMFKDELHVLAKYELFKVPIAGCFLKLMGGIPVHRGEADIEAVKAVLQVLKDNKKLLIFPEGTRNKSGSKELGEFKEGTARFSIKTKKPLLPMIYYRMPRIFRKNYLYIGEPISLDAYYSARTAEEYKQATDFVFRKMTETRALCDGYVEELKAKKKKCRAEAKV